MPALPYLASYTWTYIVYQCNCCGMCHWIANIDQCLSRVLLFLLLLSVKSTNANSDRGGGMAGVSSQYTKSLYLKVMSFTLDGHCNNGEREGVKSPYSQNSHWMVVGWPLNRNGWFYQTHATGPQLVKSWNVIIIKCVLWNWRFVLYSFNFTLSIQDNQFTADYKQKTTTRSTSTLFSIVPDEYHQII